MAWPYSGSWEGKGRQHIPEILSALCRAVNERRAATGNATHAFAYDNAGSTTAYPTSEQFTGFRDYNISLLVDDITDQIEWLVTNESFYSTTAFTTKYTVASLKSALSISDWTTMDHVFQQSVWDEMRNALNLLLYSKQTVSVSRSSVGATQSNTYDSEDGDWWELSWDDRDALSWSSNALTWNYVGGGTGKTYISSELTVTCDLSSIGGVAVTNPYLVIDQSLSWAAPWYHEFPTPANDYVVNGTSVTGTTCPQSVAVAVTLGQSNSWTATISTSEPSTNPFNFSFTDPTEYNDGGSITGTFATSMTININHSSVLTDQA